MAKVQKTSTIEFKREAVRVAQTSGTLRHEVDLATLSEHLVAVVQETMQPTHTHCG